MGKPSLLLLAVHTVLLSTCAAVANPSVLLPPVMGADPLQTHRNNDTRKIAAIGFEENKGQVHTTWDEPAPFVHYRLSQGNTNIFLLGNGIAYQFNRVHYPEDLMELMNERMRDPEDEMRLTAMCAQVRLETYRMDMILEGANSDPSITTEGRSTSYTNYYTHGALDVRTYARITYHSVYPGIDWVVYTTEQGLKYDFVVHPGADPELIELRFKDHEKLYLDPEGQLIHSNRMGSFTEQRPVSHQDGREVPTHFKLKGNRLTFGLGTYDPARTLIIDPARIWGTYFGGTGYETGYSCAVDSSMNVYLAGQTRSISGIANGGHQNTYGGSDWDAFLVKFNPFGTLLWGTYYGGTSLDWGHSCAVDPGGNVYLAGNTRSTSGIASEGHQNAYGGGDVDAFLVKFNAAGTRLWSTYHGGPDSDHGRSCAVDNGGNVYLAGYSRSSTGIASGGHQISNAGGHDAFLVKFDQTGTRLWSTYYGGTANDQGESCAVDHVGNVHLAGSTASVSGIAYGGHQNSIGSSSVNDAFLAKFDPAGTRLWGTYYGGTGPDLGFSCAVDPSGNVHMAGRTVSTTAIASNGHQNVIGGGVSGDAFLVKFDPFGTRLWGTYYGGPDSDWGNSCVVGPGGDVYMAGGTWSYSGIANGGHQNTFGGGAYYEAYLVKFDLVGTRLWGTYYGGEGHEYGSSCAVDLSGNVYLAGSTTSTWAIASGGPQETFGGDQDAFLAKFDGSIDIGISDAPNITNAATPNPTNGPLVITASRTGQRYVITDAAGRAVMEGVLLSLTNVVDLSSEPVGIYLLKVWDEERSGTIRILKQ